MTGIRQGAGRRGAAGEGRRRARAARFRRRAAGRPQRTRGRAGAAGVRRRAAGAVWFRGVAVGRHRNAVAAVGKVGVGILHLDVLVRYRNAVSAGFEVEGVILAPLGMTAQGTGISIRAGKADGERATGAADGEGTPVIHLQRAAGNGATRRDGEGIIEGAHGSVAGFTVSVGGTVDLLPGGNVLFVGTCVVVHCHVM